jgi:SM-20-related protein
MYSDAAVPALEPIARITPLMGSLVVFLSDRFPHEVTAASRLRYSIAGWFRVNASLGQQIDPPR